MHGMCLLQSWQKIVVPSVVKFTLFLLNGSIPFAIKFFNLLDGVFEILKNILTRQINQTTKLNKTTLSMTTVLTVVKFNFKCLSSSKNGNIKIEILPFRICSLK